MRVLGFSPRAYDAVQTFFSSHPVIEMRVKRDADFASPPIAIPDQVCAKCGYRVRISDEVRKGVTENLRARGEEMPRGTLPADFFNAVEFTHAWDQQSRATYCGGLLEPVTADAL